VSIPSVVGGDAGSPEGLKVRTVSFYIEPSVLSEVLSVIDGELLPQYEAMAHFRGLLVLQSLVGTRHEILGISLWEGSFEESEGLVNELVNRLYQMQGTAATTKTYQLVRWTDVAPQLPLVCDDHEAPSDESNPSWDPRLGSGCDCQLAIRPEAVYIGTCSLADHPEAMVAAARGLAETLGIPAVETGSPERHF
jgi:hypothetical protein